MESINPKKFYACFKGRTDRVVIYNSNVSKVVSLEVKKGEWEITERIKAHIEGHSRLAMYNTLQDNTCTWANVVFDEASGTPTARNSMLFAELCSTLGIAGVKREKTKLKGENYACWLFFDTPIDARKVRFFINLVLKKLGIEKFDINPAEDMLSRGSFGQYSWLPYFGGSDRWLDANGAVRVDLGVKLGGTIFIDRDSHPEAAPLSSVVRYTEKDIDNAIGFLLDYLPQDTVGEVKLLDSHVKRMLDGCLGFKKLLEKVKSGGAASEEELDLLVGIFKTLGKADYLHRVLSVMGGYDKKLLDDKIANFSALSFPSCSVLKKLGLCPSDTECFQALPPYAEKHGKFEADDSLPKDRWREPTPVSWVFKGIKERLEEEESVDTVFIDVDTSDAEDYLEKYEKEINRKRNFLIGAKCSFAGIDTGISSLNQIIGGFEADSFAVLSGKSGIGKTTLILQSCIKAAKAGKKVCYVSFGDSKFDLMSRIIASEAGIDYRKIMRGYLSNDELSNFSFVKGEIQTKYAKNLVVVEGNDYFGVKKVKVLADSIGCDFLVVDTLNSLPFISKNNAIDLVARLEQNARQLKTLARYKKIPIVAIYDSMDAADGKDYDSVIMSASDVWLSLTEGKDMGQGFKECMLFVKKNRYGDKNLSVKIACCHALQRIKS